MVLQNQLLLCFVLLGQFRLFGADVLMVEEPKLGICCELGNLGSDEQIDILDTIHRYGENFCNYNLTLFLYYL